MAKRRRLSIWTVFVIVSVCCLAVRTEHSTDSPQDGLTASPRYGVAPTRRDVVDDIPTTRRDHIPITHQDSVPITHRHSAPITHRDSAPITHRDGAPTTHRDSAPTTHRDSAPTTHRDSAPTTHRDGVPITHRDSAPTTHRDSAPTTHRDGVASTAQHAVVTTPEDAVVTPECRTAVIKMISGPTNDPDMILALDAFGKPAAGFLQGNWAWLGHYDECMSLADFNYCLTYLMFDPTSMAAPDNLTSPDEQTVSIGAVMLRWGVCVPAECSSRDVQLLTKKLIVGTKLLDDIIPTSALQEVKVLLVDCIQEQSYSAGVICTVILCCFIASLMLLGALYDEYLKMKARNVAKKLVSDGLWRTWKWDDDSPESRSDDVDSKVPLFKNGGNNYGSSSQPVRATQQEEHGLAGKLLLCFSINRNLAKLLDTQQGDASIGCVNGVRVISMTWVMLGHTLFFGVTLGITKNMPSVYDRLESNIGFQAIANAFFAVDSFFFLSGFLLAYTTLNHFREINTVKKWLLFYFHRYWRLTPLLAFVTLIFMYLSPFFGEGPVWASHNSMIDYCRKYWWTNLLYINNFWPTKILEECMIWTWYLANDMQFFIISPLILAPLYYYSSLGFLIMLVVLVISFLTTGAIIAVNGFTTLNIHTFDGLLTGGGGPDFVTLVYEKPYCRIAPYLVGIALGYIMYKAGRRRINMSPIMAVVGWIAAACMALCLVYGLYPSYLRPMSEAGVIVYGAISRFVWAVALAWVVFACKYGYGGWINTFLSWNIFIPLSRLTFATYLIHPVIIDAFFRNFGTPFNFSVYLLACYFCGMVAISYFTAVFLSLAIEYPLANIEKLLLKPRRNRTNEEVKNYSDQYKSMGKQENGFVDKLPQQNGVKSSHENGVKSSHENGVKLSHENGVKLSHENGVKSSHESGVKSPNQNGMVEPGIEAFSES